MNDAFPCGSATGTKRESQGNLTTTCCQFTHPVHANRRVELRLPADSQNEYIYIYIILRTSNDCVPCIRNLLLHRNFKYGIYHATLSSVLPSGSYMEKLNQCVHQMPNDASHALHSFGVQCCLLITSAVMHLKSAIQVRSISIIVIGQIAIRCNIR